MKNTIQKMRKMNLLDLICVNIVFIIIGLIVTVVAGIIGIFIYEFISMVTLEVLISAACLLIFLMLIFWFIGLMVWQLLITIDLITDD